jgi:hypothetical protein
MERGASSPGVDRLTVPGLDAECSYAGVMRLALSSQEEAGKMKALGFLGVSLDMVDGATHGDIFHYISPKLLAWSRGLWQPGCSVA